MGDGADYLTEWAEEIERVPVYFGNTKKSKRKKKNATIYHVPATDAEAQNLIKSLDHWVWETHKVSGCFSHTPYTITATINGKKHSISLPGRYGTTLTWLKAKLDKKEGKR